MSDVPQIPSAAVPASSAAPDIPGDPDGPTSTESLTQSSPIAAKQSGSGEHSTTITTAAAEPVPTSSPPAAALLEPATKFPEHGATVDAGSYTTVPPDQIDDLGIDVDDLDSAIATDDDFSDTTSIASSLLRGHIENGRKYSTLREDYWGPSDEKQFETMDNGHLLYLVLDSERANPLFHAAVKEPKHILDIGTGSGTWAIDVADKFPETTVYGVDMYPPPPHWVPPNCYLEIDDVQQPWTWRHKFDLIHMRLMLGGFTDEEWTRLYGQCFENMESGGWIEQVELDVRVMSDDGTLPPDSLLAGWGENFLGCAERSGRSLATQTTMKAKIEAAGFVDVQDRLYKCPIGAWPRDRLLKEAGRVNLQHWSSGLEGWAMWLLTKHGSPTPWSADEVRVYVAKVRQELKNPNLHIYHFTRRVWGRKP